MTGPDLHDVPSVRNARRRYITVAWGAGIVISLAIIATLVIVAVSQERLVEIAKGNRANGRAIRDCTIPGGQCYERSRANTANVVGQLVDAIQRNDQRAAIRSATELQAVANVCHQLQAAHVVKTCPARP